MRSSLCLLKLCFHVFCIIIISEMFHNAEGSVASNLLQSRRKVPLLHTRSKTPPCTGPRDLVTVNEVYLGGRGRRKTRHPHV